MDLKDYLREWRDTPVIDLIEGYKGGGWIKKIKLKASLKDTYNGGRVRDMDVV